MPLIGVLYQCTASGIEPSATPSSVGTCGEHDLDKTALFDSPKVLLKANTTSSTRALNIQFHATYSRYQKHHKLRFPLPVNPHTCVCVCVESFQVGRLKGCASVFSTHSSKLIKSSSAKSK